MTEHDPSHGRAPVEPEARDDAGARAKPLSRLPVANPEEALVPARMINEVLYCERLMYLEWVQGEWADNFYTVEGTSVHKRADKPHTLRKAGKKPEAEPAPTQEAGAGKQDPADLPYQARSVWLSSERLGITAKIDVIDVDADSVVPVEYKRGKQPDVPEGAWLPERAQLCAQVMLLREHGYHCDEAAIYYAGDHRRVPITIDEALIGAVHGAVDRARALRESGKLPPPLMDSPKCAKCSLVGICLPDEVNLLAHAEALEPARLPDEDDPGPDPWGLTPDEPVEEPAPVRRLYPARDDKLPVYVQEQGAYLRLAGERLVIQQKSGPAQEARLGNTSQVSLFGNVQVSSQALRELCRRAVPISLFSAGGWLMGRAGGFDSNNVQLRLAHYRATLDPAFCRRVASAVVVSKILNCRTLLRRNHSAPSAVALSELKQLARKAGEAGSLESLLGIEGTAARVYFREFDGMLKAKVGSFDLQGRNRRPPRDPVNALLSFCYSLLTKELVNAVQAVGLDPMLGFYHQPRFGRPGLALDLMEEFRPLVADSTVFGAINNGVVREDDFVVAAGGVSLKPAARRRLIHAFERRMDQLVTHPLFDYRVSYRRVLELQARLLSRLIQNEIQEYPAFRTR